MIMSKNNVLFLFIIFTALVLSNTGCTRKVQETSVIELSLPSGSSFNKISEFKYSEPMSMYSVSAQGDDDGAEWNPALNPANVSDVNCYMIAVAGPESDMRRNTCTTTTGTNLKIGRFVGGIPAGSTLSLEVPSGPQREVIVIGFKASPGACTNFKTTDVSGMSLSEPHILGKIVKDLTPGAMAVTVPITINAGTLKIDDCEGPDFKFEQAPLYFGDKIVSDGTTTINTNSTYSSLGGSSFQVVNFNTQPPNPNEAHTILNAPTAISGIVAGDEVMITIQGLNGGWTNDVGPCGYRAWEGRFAFGRVAAVSGSQLFISKGTFADKLNWNPVSNSFDSTIKATVASNMGSTPNSNVVFCKMRVSKVLHYYNLTVSAEITPDMFEFNAPTSGILPIRVANLLTLESGASFNASNLGYMPSTTNHGTGIRGSSSITCTATPTNTGTGGSCSPAGQGAGGGGHGNSPGNSPFSPSGGTGGGGSQIGGNGAGEDCGDGSCFGTLTHKIFMGGAGGSSSNSLAGTGGAGGGIIYLMANNIVVDGGASVSILSNGEVGDPNSSYTNYGAAGGGAGGSILLGFKNFTLMSGSAIEVSASGGDGGSASATGSSGGGGGGGGRIHYLGCSTSVVPVSSPSLQPFANGGAGGNFGSGGVAGNQGLNGSIVKQSVNCN